MIIWFMLFSISMRLTFSGICFATPFFTHFTHGIKLTDEGASSLSIFKRVELQLQMRNFYTWKHIQYNAKHYFNIHHNPTIRCSKALSCKRSMVAHTTQTQGTQRIPLNDISKCQKIKLLKIKFLIWNRAPVKVWFVYVEYEYFPQLHVLTIVILIMFILVTLMKRTRMRCTDSFQLVTSISMRWRANIDYLCHLLMTRRIVTARNL